MHSGEHEQNTNMEARTEDCIAMVPTGSRTGSVKMMSMATGKIVTRDQYRVLPMPQSVINRLNEMAAAEGKKILQRTNMSRDVEGGLETMDKPSYIRLNQEPPANGQSYNPIRQEQYNDDARVEFEFDPSVVNDVTGYPEDSDIAIKKSVTFYDPADLDVGELQEFALPDEVYETYKDAFVPVSPPRSTVPYEEERVLNIVQGTYVLCTAVPYIRACICMVGDLYGYPNRDFQKRTKRILSDTTTQKFLVPSTLKLKAPFFSETQHTTQLDDIVA